MVISDEINPINEYLAIYIRTYENEKGKKSSNRELIANPVTMLKSMLLTKKRPNLPYSCSLIPNNWSNEEFPFALWWAALGYKCDVSNKEYRDQIMKIDFWKYDDKKANDILDKFSIQKKSKPIIVDIEDIELGREDDNEEE